MHLGSSGPINNFELLLSERTNSALCMSLEKLNLPLELSLCFTPVSRCSLVITLSHPFSSYINHNPHDLRQFEIGLHPHHPHTGPHTHSVKAAICLYVISVGFPLHGQSDK